ncbi:hypothetical protein EVAR_97993_1 [Eumeta japonica]|uniref:Uncharacterized protein n=1 Tax=Eumeta variegata TaxID=151549 RepID=A0A4C1WLI8_EUMVA|nr:hypothetical protein EVAR_97993_1 [Eumeta japonica]
MELEDSRDERCALLYGVLGRSLYEEAIRDIQLYSGLRDTRIGMRSIEEEEEYLGYSRERDRVLEWNQN